MPTMTKKMAFLSSLIAVGTLLSACQSPPQSQAMSYPSTRQGDAVDVYFDTQVADPYRWLEDDRSSETKAWVKAQNAVTRAYLEQIPYREQIASTLSELLNFERVSAPFIKGDYRYFYKNDGLQNQSVVYREKLGKSSEDKGQGEGKGDPEIFIDPNTFSADGTVSLASLSFSEDGSLVAYQTSTGGSDWRTVYVMDVASKSLIGEPLQNVKFSGIAWLANKGFYYSSYDKPTGSELSDKTDQHKVYFHKIGTNQAADLPVFGGP